MMKPTPVLVATVICIASAGCAVPDRVDLATHTGGSAFLFNQFQAFDGQTGRPLRFSDVIRHCRRAVRRSRRSGRGGPGCHPRSRHVPHRRPGMRRLLRSLRSPSSIRRSRRAHPVLR